jgi:hypothetical protein
MLRGSRTLSSTLPTCSLTYCCVLAAHGVNEALSRPCQHISILCPSSCFRKFSTHGGQIDVRDALAKGCDLSKIVHDVCNVVSLIMRVWFRGLASSGSSCPGALLGPPTHCRTRMHNHRVRLHHHHLLGLVSHHVYYQNSPIYCEDLFLLNVTLYETSVTRRQIARFTLHQLHFVS